MSFSLSDIEAVKTVTFYLKLHNVALNSPLTFNYLPAGVYLGFMPDFVKVKLINYFDAAGSASQNFYTVNANFIRDNDILFAFNPAQDAGTNVTFVQSCDILHRYVPNSQLSFSVNEAIGSGTAPGVNSLLVFTLEFSKLKTK